MSGWKFFLDFGSDSPECQVCSREFLCVEVEGLGWVCYRHFIDWALDDYKSEYDYTLTKPWEDSDDRDGDEEAEPEPPTVGELLENGADEYIDSDDAGDGR